MKLLSLETVQSRLTALMMQAVDRGFYAPDVYLRFEAEKEPILRCILWLDSRFNNGSISCSIRNINGFDETLEDALARASTWIDEQRTPNQLLQERVLQKLAQAVDEAKEAGIDEIVLDTITTKIRELSDNIITHMKDETDA
jgi:hypothetical protein